MTEERLRPLLDLEVSVSEPVSMGRSDTGERRMIPITGGHFQGKLQGRVLPGGADWQVIRPDGVADIAARYVLETDKGARIEVRSEGYRHGPPEVMARLARGEAVDPTAYYFRTSMRFETGAPELAWLNRTLALAWGERRPERVLLTVLEVL